MSRISRQRLKSMLVYIPTTGEWRRPRGYKLRRGQRRDKIGTANKVGGRQIQIDGKIYLSAVLAWFYVKGKWPTKVIDHKDRDPSNDRWKNLRHGSQSQNCGNSPCRSNNAIGHKNVSKIGRGYRVIVQRKYLGRYRSLKTAIDVATQGRRKIFGEFACHE